MKLQDCRFSQRAADMAEVAGFAYVAELADSLHWAYYSPHTRASEVGQLYEMAFDDDMLSSKFGKEVTNYFAGLPLNRVGFLRGDHGFLNAAVKHPSTSFLLFNNLGPLVKDDSKLAFVNHKDVEPLIGKNPFRQSEKHLIAEYNSTVGNALLVMLGLDETQKNGMAYKTYSGAPYFALDVTPLGSIREQAQGVISAVESRGLQFFYGRSHMKFSPEEAAIFSMGRAVMDWNSRNPYCSQCGNSTLSVQAGFKRACPPTDLGKTSVRRPDCTTRTTVSNVSFCRTDPSIIVAVVSNDGTKTLMGHNGRWQPHWYSTLAGFCEPGESAEEATRREVYEETGVRIGRVIIHSTQPWPYPSSLMIGAIAQALPGEEEVSLEHDQELLHAKWFNLPDVEDALEHRAIPMGEPAPLHFAEGKLRVPPPTAVAHQLLRAIVGGYMKE